MLVVDVVDVDVVDGALTSLLFEIATSPSAVKTKRPPSMPTIEPILPKRLLVAVSTVPPGWSGGS